MDAQRKLKILWTTYGKRTWTQLVKLMATHQRCSVDLFGPPTQNNKEQNSAEEAEKQLPKSPLKIQVDLTLTN